MGPIGEFRIGQSRGDSKDRPADATINRRNHEGRQPHPKNLHPDISGLSGVLAYGAQMQPKRRLGHAPHRQTEQREQYQRVIVKRAGEKRRFAAAPFHAEQQRPQHAHALVAAGDGVKLEQKRVKEHSECKRQHAEENPGVADAQHADHQ